MYKCILKVKQLYFLFYLFIILFQSILDPGTTSIGIYTPVVAFPSIDSIH